jgi:hypothetical protein
MAARRMTVTWLAMKEPISRMFIPDILFCPCSKSVTDLNPAFSDSFCCWHPLVQDTVFIFCRHIPKMGWHSG